MNDWVRAINQCVQAEKHSKLPPPVPTPIEILPLPIEAKQITTTCDALAYMVVEDLAKQKLADAKRLEVSYPVNSMSLFLYSLIDIYLYIYLSIC